MPWTEVRIMSKSPRQKFAKIVATHVNRVHTVQSEEYSQLPTIPIDDWHESCVHVLPDWLHSCCYYWKICLPGSHEHFHAVVYDNCAHAHFLNLNEPQTNSLRIFGKGQTYSTPNFWRFAPKLIWPICHKKYFFLSEMPSCTVPDNTSHDVKPALYFTFACKCTNRQKKAPSGNASSIISSMAGIPEGLCEVSSYIISQSHLSCW